MTRRRVLVCDDDELFRSFLVRMLELHGFECRAASDGEAAIGLLEAGERFDLALVDLLMPVRSGWEVIAALRRADEGSAVPVRVIAITGLAPAENEIVRLREQRVELLTKDGNFAVDRFLRLVGAES